MYQSIVFTDQHTNSKYNFFYLEQKDYGWRKTFKANYQFIAFGF